MRSSRACLGSSWCVGVCVGARQQPFFRGVCFVRVFLKVWLCFMLFVLFRVVGALSFAFLLSDFSSE